MYARSHHQVAPPVAGAAAEFGDINLIGTAHGYGRDQQIFSEGEAATYVYKVISGAVRSLRLLADGRRQITDFYLPGDVFGVERGGEHGCAAETLGETVLIVARRSVFAADPDFVARLWGHALGELRRSQDQVLTLGRRSAAERVASFLLDLADRLDTGDQLTLPMTRQDIADYLGLTIETVSRSFSQLQADGLIKTGGCRQVRLMRPKALAELCE
jgi:CRP/FNR family transcriptional regulator/CRP/FNR family nitrogen fixation transcriptional regulator